MNAVTMELDPSAPTIVTIHGNGGRHLLSIHPDGRIEGEVADASEAGRIFAEAVVSRMCDLGTIRP